MDKNIIYELIKIDKNLQENEKVIYELGCADGRDTLEFIELIPNLEIHCFEPDKRNIENIKSKIFYNKLYLFEGAIYDTNGEMIFNSSNTLYSGSVKKPKNHLKYWDFVTFNQIYKIKTITLDYYTQLKNVNHIDFIWADIQGAEENMLLGGKETLEKTSFLYTEYSEDEYYEGQINLGRIKEILGDRWKLLKNWDNRPGGGDVLFFNSSFYNDQQIQKIYKICETI